jgi:hypothetical protein
MAEEKNWIQGPLDPTAKGVMINGVPYALIADLPEGGFVQIINGDNPMGQAMPGPQITKGCMIVAISADIAAHLRAGIKQEEARQRKELGQPGVIGGRVVAPSAFDKPDPDFGLTH